MKLSAQQRKALVNASLASGDNWRPRGLVGRSNTVRSLEQLGLVEMRYLHPGHRGQVRLTHEGRRVTSTILRESGVTV